MQLYKYTAIITKNIVGQGKVTFTDKRSLNGAMLMPLESKAKVGHVLAECDEEAKGNAMQKLKALYPEERGYRGHQNVRVEAIDETIVE